MRKNVARMGMLSSLLGLMGLGSLTTQPVAQSKDVQNKYEGKQVVTTFWGGSQPIYIPSHSQKVKSKKLRVSNKRQGRV